MKKYIPNIITTIRLLAACLFPIIFIYDLKVAIIIFIVASLSDSVDGFLARRWNVISEYGKRIDPIADKLLVGASLILATLCINKTLAIPLILEIFIAFLNVVLYRKSNMFNVTKCGKIKSIFLYPLIAIGLLTYIYSDLYIIFYLLMTIVTIFQVITIISYIKQYKERPAL